MPDLKKVIKGLECCTATLNSYNACPTECPYYGKCMEGIDRVFLDMMNDALALLKAQEEERKRMITWIAKFCRHIDNGDRWLTDQENLEFFKEKMKRQFGWEFPEPPKEG